MESLTRNTAHKIWISDLLTGTYGKGQEQFDAGYIETRGKKISRVNLICGVVDKFSGNNYATISLDDGSGVIQLKAWNENTVLFLDVEVGDLVLTIGKIKQYNNSVYVTPEVVRKLDNPLWLKLRKLELTKEYGEAKRVESLDLRNNETSSKQESDDNVMNVVEEKVGNFGVNSREIIMGLVESLDRGDGVELNEIITKSRLGDAGLKVVTDLVNDGQIFELHKGKFRVMG